MIEQRAMSLNQAFRDHNRQKIMNILSLPEAERILKQEDDNKYTPFFWACSSLPQDMALEIVPIILSKGADPYKIDKYLQNVLYYIAKTNKDRLLSYLIQKYNYDLNTNDQIRQSPIFFAAANGQVQTAKVLFENGADINHVDGNNQNCLFWAAGGGHLQMCEFLVSKGINFLKVDGNKQTALHYAKRNGHPSVVAYLQEAKSKQKKSREIVKEVNRVAESSQQQDRAPRKKKQLMKQKYIIVYTSEKGEVHELTMQQLEEFGQANEANANFISLINHADRLDNYPMPEQKKFEKATNKILNHFMKHQQGPIFLLPVDYVALGIPHYPNIIKRPMDFTSIKTKLNYNAYDSEVDFYQDMNLVFDNCSLFNGADSSYSKIAIQMKLEFNTLYKKQFGL